MTSAFRRAVAATAAVAALASASPSPAFAEGPAINPAGSDFPELAYTLQVPDRIALESSAVTVRENGAPVDGVVLESAAGAGGGSFATVLVIDATETMRGEPIAEAMRAARAFADRRQPEQSLAVLAFNEDTKTVLPFSTDDGEIAAALADEPPIATSTDLYEATGVALEMLSDAGVKAGSVVVLSDGADTGTSAVDLPEVAAAAEDSGIRIFTVGLRSKHTEIGALKDLAVGGAFADAAKPEDLAPIFDRFGAQLASEYLLSYSSTSESGKPVTVEVQVDGLAGIARDQYDAPGAADAGGPEPLQQPAGSVEARGFWGSPAAMVAAIALAAGLFGMALFALVRPRRQTAHERIAGFFGPDRAQTLTRQELEPDDRRSSPLVPFERTLERRQWWTRFKEELGIAGIEVDAVRIVAATAAAWAFVTLIGALAGVPAIVVLGLLVPFGVRVWIRHEVRATRQEFADQLADSLQLVVSALRAGQSMASALAVVVDESPEPTRGEFRRIVTDEGLGIALEDAIRKVAKRMDNRDLEQVALVATIQRETGGNTAEVLEQVIETIRERGKLRRLMKTLTAQGRLSQIVVSALPLALLVAVSLLNADYVSPLFDTGAGRIALAVGAVLSVVGSLVIKRIVEIKV